MSWRRLELVSYVSVGLLASILAIQIWDLVAGWAQRLQIIIPLERGAVVEKAKFVGEAEQSMTFQAQRSPSKNKLLSFNVPNIGAVSKDIYCSRTG